MEYHIDYNKFDWQYAAESFDMRDVLTDMLDTEVDSRGRCCCPVHQGSDKNFSVYEHSGMCWSHCGRFNTISVVAKAQGISSTKAFFELCQTFGRDPRSYPGVTEELENGELPESIPEKSVFSPYFSGKTNANMRRNLGFRQDITLPVRIDKNTREQLDDHQIACLTYSALWHKAQDLQKVTQIAYQTCGVNLKWAVKSGMKQYVALERLCESVVPELLQPKHTGQKDVDQYLLTLCPNLKHLQKAVIFGEDKDPAHSLFAEIQDRLSDIKTPLDSGKIITEESGTDHAGMDIKDDFAKYYASAYLDIRPDDYNKIITFSPDGLQQARIDPEDYMEKALDRIDTNIDCICDCEDVLKFNFPNCHTKEMKDAVDKLENARHLCSNIRQTVVNTYWNVREEKEQANDCRLER